LHGVDARFFLPLPLPAFSPSGPRAKFRLAMERAMERAIARGEGHRPSADQHLRATPRMFHRKSRRFNSINNGALFAFLAARSVVVKSRTTTTAGNNWPPSRTKTAARTLNDLNDRAGKVLCRTACRDAPPNQNVARSKEVPANACGWIAKHVCRLCFNPAPKTPGGADAPIECRSRRALRDEPDHGARDERSGDEPNHGASATEMPSHIDRRGRR
jgi:hypothetical protein